VADQGHEDLVEARPAQAELGHGDAGRVEAAQQGGQDAGLGHGHAEQAAVADPGRLGPGQLGHHGRDPVQVVALGRAGVEVLAPDLGLELVGAPGRDHPAVVDHGDLGGELVGLLQVLGGQQDGGAVGDQLADHVPDLAPAARVEPGGGLVQAQDGGPADEAGGQVEAAAHAARVGLDRAAARVGQVEALQQLPGPGPGVAARELEQAGDQDQVLGPGQLLVDGGVLAGQADQAPDPVGLADHVEAADAGVSAVRAQQGGQDAHGRRLAGPVRAEQAEDRALADGQVDPGERRGLAEPLDQALGLDDGGHDSVPFRHMAVSSATASPGPLTARAHGADERCRMAHSGRNPPSNHRERRPHT
jgi:hypothetical protein